jgi:hypothetical protein
MSSRVGIAVDESQDDRLLGSCYLLDRRERASKPAAPGQYDIGTPREAAEWAISASFAVGRSIIGRVEA